MRPAAPFLVALVAACALVASYVALGGTSFEPTPVADPCVPRDWRNPGGVSEVLEQIVLSGLDGAACRLHVSREELVLALDDDRSLDEFAAEHGISRAEAEEAVGRGMKRAVADADAAGAMPGGLTGRLIRGAVERVPARLVLDLLEDLRGLVD